MELLVEKLSKSDANVLFEFERENKDFFEKSVPPRSNDYYDFNKFLIILDSLIDEQNKGDSYFYLIKNVEGSILGRINIVDIDRTNGHGYLGYRIGSSYTRKGIASQALNILKEMLIREKSITQLSAKTTTDNVGSQKVLEKNGFKVVNPHNHSINEIDDENYDFIYYHWSLE
ncbi:GNAT family N-acetyltransferase [Heyndrickxia sp. NPDC080065]|uniref:GNAT family N-acetyltransferase n=1 Tax=Heyndrickxia sp. NPDC080065 TaxID=3390568 RepID=UPI003D07E81D